MKVAIIVDSLAGGGAERQAIVCVSELRKLGHHADLLHYHPQCEYTRMLEGLNLSPIYIEAKGFPQRCRRLSSVLQNGAYEVVHGFKMSAEVYAALAGSWAGVPHRFGCFRNLYNLGLKHRCLHYVVDKFLDAWIVNSEAVAVSMSRSAHIARGKIEVLQNGVSDLAYSSSLSSTEAKAKFGFEPTSLLITMVARLEPQKNYPLLLEIARQVVSQEPRARFAICGKGSQEQMLKGAAAEKGLNGAVSFLGYRTDVPDLIAATDISVLTTDYEGLPNVIIEQMSAGKPIVCTDYPGAREIMTHGKTALLSPCGQAEPFVHNLLSVMRDATLRHQLATNAIEFARREFSPATMGRKLESIYRKYVDAGN